MNKLKYLLFAGMMFIVAYACSDEFLEVNPQGSLDGVALEAPAGIEASLVGAYSILDGWASQWSVSSPWPSAADLWIFGDIVTDDSHKGSDASDLVEGLELELFQWSPSNPLLDGFFQARYEGIARANATLALNNVSTDIEPARQLEIDGEAKFLRAHYHFDLYKVFRNIPYYTEEDAEFKKTNDVDVAPMIIADLMDAFNQLPVNFSDKGRATKGAADAYLGRVKMFTGDIPGAKVHLARVATPSTYGYDLTPCFHDNFNADTENSSESIFAVQFSTNDGDGGGNNGNYGSRLGFPHSGSPFGCCGFHQPTQNLVNAFKTDATGVPLLDTWNTDNLTATDNVDPRLDWTAGRDNVPYFDWGLHGISLEDGSGGSWIRDRSHGGNFSPKKQQFHKHQQGDVGSGSSGGAWGNQASALNYNIIRLADIKLMLAEAEAMTGNPAAAMAQINDIRARAGACAQGPGTSASDIAVAIDDASISWATYSVEPYPASFAGFSDAATALKAAKFERRLELGLEGHRMTDLRRWGDLESTMNTYLATAKTRRPYLNNANTVEAKHNAYPLPSVQIALSEDGGVQQLKQNTGF